MSVRTPIQTATRRAVRRDLRAPHVESGTASFEVTAPDAAEMARRIEAAARSHAWLVHEVGGAVGGFAGAGPHRTRGAYRWAADVAVYVGAAHVGQGLGSALYGALLPLQAPRRAAWPAEASALGLSSRAPGCRPSVAI